MSQEIVNSTLLRLPLEEILLRPREMMVTQRGDLFTAYRDDEDQLVPLEEMGHGAPRLEIKVVPGSFGKKDRLGLSEGDRGMTKFLRKYAQQLAEAVGETLEQYIENLPPISGRKTEIETRFKKGYGNKASFFTTDFFVDPRISANALRDIIVGSKAPKAIQRRDDDMPEEEPRMGKPYIAHGLDVIHSVYIGTFMMESGQARNGRLNELIFFSQQQNGLVTENLFALGSTQNGQTPFLRDRMRYNQLEVGRVDESVLGTKDSPGGYIFLVKE